MFVNADTLAEMWSYFQRVCFRNGFKESADGCATLPIETFNDIVQLLQCMCQLKPLSGQFYICHLQLSSMIFDAVIRRKLYGSLPTKVSSTITVYPFQ